MNRDVLDQWCERGILAFVLAILVVGPLAFGGSGMGPFLALEGLTLGVLALWVVRLWVGPRPKLLWPPICWAVVAFAAYAVGRYVTADVEYTARLELIRVLVYAFLFLAILNNIYHQESIQLISYALFALAVGLSFLAGYQFLTGSNHIWGLALPFAHRGSGTYVNANHLGGFLELLLPLALAYTLVSRLKPALRVFAGYAALVMLGGIVATVSRGCWFSVALTLVFFLGVLVFLSAHRLPALVVAVVVVGIGGYFLTHSFSLQQRLKQLTTEDGQVDDDMRLKLWRPALAMWGDHLLWGVGPGLFDCRFRAYRPQNVQQDPQLVHNDYLNTLTDWGIVGAGLVLSAWVLLSLGIRKTWKFVHTDSGLGGHRGSNRFAFVLGAAFGLLAILFHSVVDFNMHLPANAILVVTLMALISGHLRFASDKYWVSLRLWSRALAGLVVGAGLVYLAQQEWQLKQEYGWLRQAEAAPEYSPEKIGFLKKAFAVEPRNWQTAYAIGEALQIHCREGGEFYPDFGGVDYRQLGREAMEWLERSQKLNPWHAYSYSRYGLCLDWLGRSSEATGSFVRAQALDPNGCVLMLQVGMHYFEAGDYAAARSYFERSLNLEAVRNPEAASYWEMASRRLAAAAAARGGRAGGVVSQP